MSFFSEISNQAERSNKRNCSIASELQALGFLSFLECHLLIVLSSYCTCTSVGIYFENEVTAWKSHVENCTALHVFQSHENRAVLDTTPSLSANFVKFLLNCSFQPACWHCLHPSGSLGPTPGWQTALSCGTCSKCDLEAPYIMLGKAISLDGAPDPGPFLPSLALNHYSG